MIFAGILAAGIGSRINSDMPKQFAKIKDVPLFARVAKVFLDCEKIDKIFVSVNKDWEDVYSDMIKKYSLDRNRLELVIGGNSRFDSLVSIVKSAYEYDQSPENVILTHDCARLFADREIIEKNIKEIENYDIITTCIPVADTLVYCENDNIVSSVPPREKLWDGVTPQTFYVNVFMSILENLPKEKYSDYNEAGKLFLDFGRKYGVIEGSRNLFKITNDIDLQYAEFLIDKGFIKIKNN